MYNIPGLSHHTPLLKMFLVLSTLLPPTGVPVPPLKEIYPINLYRKLICKFTSFVSGTVTDPRLVKSVTLVRRVTLVRTVRRSGRPSGRSTSATHVSCHRFHSNLFSGPDGELQKFFYIFY